MRDVRNFGEKLATLVELLNEMGTLEIRASIRLTHARPGSDQARLLIHFTGRDTPVLTADNGQVLDAIEVLATEILGLSGTERDAIEFDAGEFLAEQEEKLRRAADLAVGRVRFTGSPFIFPPMSSRDRRLLVRALVTSGLYFETLGGEMTRWVVLFPKDVQPALEVASRDFRAD